jgi:hypothetical protein
MFASNAWFPRNDNGSWQCFPYILILKESNDACSVDGLKLFDYINGAGLVINKIYGSPSGEMIWRQVPTKGAQMSSLNNKLHESGQSKTNQTTNPKQPPTTIPKKP